MSMKELQAAMQADPENTELHVRGQALLDAIKLVATELTPQEMREYADFFEESTPFQWLDRPGEEQGL